MNQILLNQAKEKRAKLLKDIRELDIVIQYLEKTIKPTGKACRLGEKAQPHAGSKMALAGDLCVKLIKKDNNIVSSSQFMKYVKENGIEISTAGLSIALRNAGLVFNRDRKLWELQG